MDEPNSREDLRLRVRALLSARRLRLWLPPYQGPDGAAQMKILAESFSKELNLNMDEVLEALEDLKNHSAERAKANDHFKDTGIATLRITTTVVVKGSKNFLVNLKLDSMGCKLLEQIAEELSIEAIRIKLIHRGQVVKYDLSLAVQNINNGAQILAIILSATPENLKKNADMYILMNLTRSDAELLSQDDLGESFMQLEDQSGNPLYLPKNEKRALMVAMALHERGRTAMKEANYSLALIFLLEADKHFSECNAGILKTVDNYALLNLDIAWCYLRLQSITHIPDAEARLTICEKKFHTSYGSNLERLIALKGSSGNEKALFMRLHLLQGVVFYHLNKRTEAKNILKKAEQELNFLKPDENSICTLVEMGYTLTEARFGLRASNGNVPAAIEFVKKSRKEKEERNKKALEEAEGRALGWCDDKKQFVSMKCVQMLIDMGYSKKTAVLALKKSNNIVPTAVQIIQEMPDTLKESDLPKSLSNEKVMANCELVQQLVDIGYDSGMASEALKRTANDLNDAIDMLVKYGGIVVDYVDSNNGASSSQNTDAEAKRTAKKVKKMKAAFARLCDGIDVNKDDYLDLTLTEEETILNQYLNMLK